MNQNKTFTLSLSRWHTIAKRLSVHGEALFENAMSVLGSANVQHELGDTQKAALVERGSKALADLTEARSAISTAALVRAALSHANAQHGISAKLAMAEGMRREVQLLDQLGRIDLLARVELDKANDTLTKRTTSEDIMGTRRLGALPVALVAIDALDTHARDKSLLERQQQELMDEINDLNRNTLSIELPVDIAAHASL